VLTTDDQKRRVGTLRADHWRGADEDVHSLVRLEVSRVDDQRADGQLPAAGDFLARHAMVGKLGDVRRVLDLKDGLARSEPPHPLAERAADRQHRERLAHRAVIDAPRQGQEPAKPGRLSELRLDVRIHVVDEGHVEESRESARQPRTFLEALDGVVASAVDAKQACGAEQYARI